MIRTTGYLALHFANLIHFLLLLFVLLGWIFSSENILIWHATLSLLLPLHWKLNNGKCFITNLEYLIIEKFDLQRKIKINKGTEDQASGEVPFTKRLLEKLGIKLTDLQLKWFLHFVIFSSAAASLFKLL